MVKFNSPKENRMSRKYSVKELDELRQVVRCKWISGYYGCREGFSMRMSGPGEMENAVEQQVRTHMLAGHTAGDLLDSERHLTTPPENQCPQD